MKYTLNCLFVPAVFLLLFSGCTKKHTARLTSSYYLSASSPTIGSFSSSGTYLTAGGALGAKLEIDANTVSGKRITLYISPYSGTGTFSVAGTQIGGVYYSSAVDTVISSVHGTITLTSVSPDIIGTFKYTGSDSSVFTGSFDVPAP